MRIYPGISSSLQLKFLFSRSIDFHDIRRQYLLERLSLIFMCREPEGGDDDVTLVEPARRQKPSSFSTMLHFWITPDSCLLDCTLKASPWRTTFKIFVSICCLC